MNRRGSGSTGGRESIVRTGAGDGPGNPGHFDCDRGAA